MQIVSNVALISINETLVVQLISFLIFLFIINRIMFRPLRRIVVERDNHIQKIRLDIADAEKALRSTTEQLRQKEMAVRGEAQALSKAVEDRGKQRSAELIAAVRDEIADLKRQTQKEIDAQLAEARKTLTAESQTLAEHIMEKLLSRRLIS